MIVAQEWAALERFVLKPPVSAAQHCFYHDPRWKNW